MDFLEATASQRALNDSIMDYTVRYPSENREPVIRYKEGRIHFQTRDGQKPSGREKIFWRHMELLEKEDDLMTDYWTKYNVADSIWRRAGSWISLGFYFLIYSLVIIRYIHCSGVVI